MLERGDMKTMYDYSEGRNLYSIISGGTKISTEGGGGG